MARALRNYQHVDYSSLLFELNHPNTEKPVRAAESETVIPIPNVSEARRRRDRLMGDRSMRYAYSEIERILHDRDCDCVAKIKDEHFHMEQTLQPEMGRCEQCYRRAVIRAGIPLDRMKQINMFARLFDAFRAPSQSLEKLILEHKASLYKAEPNTVYLKVWDDRWFIRREQGQLALYHNNYRVTDDLCREFSGGFHLQVRGESFRRLVSIMCEYSWEGHKQRIKAKLLETQKRRLSAQLVGIANFVPVKRFSLFFTYYTVLDCKGRCARYCRKQQVHLKVIDRERLEDPYSKILCRIPKWETYRFQVAASRLKGYCVEALRHEYAVYCRTEL